MFLVKPEYFEVQYADHGNSRYIIVFIKYLFEKLPVESGLVAVANIQFLQLSANTL